MRVSTWCVCPPYVRLYVKINVKCVIRMLPVNMTPDEPTILKYLQEKMNLSIFVGARAHTHTHADRYATCADGCKKQTR